MANKQVWNYEEEARLAELDIVDAGLLVKLIKVGPTTLSRDGEVIPDGPPKEYEFPALFKSYSDKDWADSKIENFYAIHASDRYLVGAAHTLTYVHKVRPEADDKIIVPVLGIPTEFIVIRVQTLDLDGWPVLFRQIQLRGSHGTNPR